MAGVRISLLSFAVAVPLFLSSGCGSGHAPTLAYALIGSEEGRAVVTLVFDSRVAPGEVGTVSFSPQPKCGFSLTAAGEPAQVKVVFEKARPFPKGKTVEVRLGSGVWGGSQKRVCIRGKPYPRLRRGIWHDRNHNLIVDERDVLSLQFDSEVSVNCEKEPARIPASEFVLPTGMDSLGRFESEGVNGPLAEAGEDGNSVLLELGEGAVLTPVRRAGETGSKVGLNATGSAPSRWIKSNSSGLGAVCSGYVPVVSSFEKFPFSRVGGMKLGASPGNLNPTITFCKKNSSKGQASGKRKGPFVVLAGGNKKGTLEPASGVFVFDVNRPGRPFWAGSLKTERSQHCAVSLPVPEESPLLGAVLFVGGLSADGAVKKAEILRIHSDGTADIRWVNKGGEGGERLAAGRRVQAEAVYVPDGEDRGFVLIAGGDVGGLMEQFASMFRVSWPESGGGPGISPVETGPSYTPVPNRTFHSLTVVDSPEGPGEGEGEKAVFLFGGKVSGKAGYSTVAMPYMFFPGRAYRNPQSDWFRDDFGAIDEGGLRRQGHGAVYLPEAGKVVIVGGEVKAEAIRTGWEGRYVYSVVEFDLRRRVFKELRGVLPEAKVDPELVLLRAPERVLVLGGWVQDGPARTCGAYFPEQTSGKQGYFSFGALLPEEIGGASAQLLAGENGSHGEVYLAGGKSNEIWKLEL